MKVQTCGLIDQGILDIDNDLVAFGGYNGRDRPLSVDADYWAVVLAVRIGVGPCYVEVIGDSRCLSC